MIRFLLGAGLVALVLLVWSFFDVLFTRAPRAGRRGLWLLIVLVPLLGPAAWLWRGRPRASRSPRPQRPVRGPDDDPDFLLFL